MASCIQHLLGLNHTLASWFALIAYTPIQLYVYFQLKYDSQSIAYMHNWYLYC